MLFSLNLKYNWTLLLHKPTTDPDWTHTGHNLSGLLRVQKLRVLPLKVIPGVKLLGTHSETKFLSDLHTIELSPLVIMFLKRWLFSGKIVIASSCCMTKPFWKCSISPLYSRNLSLQICWNLWYASNFNKTC